MSEINEDVCSCCGKIPTKIILFHLDGDKNNFSKKNIIKICRRCNGIISRDFKKLKREMSHETREKILYLRERFLVNFYYYTKKDAKDRIKYERAVSSNHGKMKRCLICGSKEHLDLYAPDFITKFDEENSKGLGIIICKTCSKSGMNLKDLNLVSNVTN